MSFYFLIIGVLLFLGGQTGKTGPVARKTGDNKEKLGRTRKIPLVNLLSPPAILVGCVAVDSPSRSPPL